MIEFPEAMDRHLIIVGAGPRGLSALESLYKALADSDAATTISVLMFEETEMAGYGHVYNIDQLESNWLNISERALTIDGRPELKWLDYQFPGFPSYHEWADSAERLANTSAPDIYPPRRQLGQYFLARFESLTQALADAGLFQLIQARIDAVHVAADGFKVVTAKGSTHRADEVVLAIGHQPTELADQIKTWQEHTKAHPQAHLFPHPYPLQHLLDDSGIHGKSVVALRGFGLAMMDTVRALTMEKGGQFTVIDEATQAMRYTHSPDAPQKIVPFSLDGLPMSPKPLNAEIDAWFAPSDKQMAMLRKQLGIGAAAEGDQFLIAAMAAVAAVIFRDLGPRGLAHALTLEELEAVITAWLEDGGYAHPLLTSREDPPGPVMQAFAGMATGTARISLDYCVGEVWRHCQPLMYEVLSHSGLPDAAMGAVTALDERMKRHAFGPPVGSIQQLLALIEAGVMTLRVVDDPDIELVPEGWKFVEGDDVVVAHVMVDTVLDNPELLEVTAPVIEELLNDTLLEPVHDKLGVRTAMNGCVQTPRRGEVVPLAVLGRLAKGSLFGVDAVLECFGGRIDDWARGVLERT